MSRVALAAALLAATVPLAPVAAHEAEPGIVVVLDDRGELGPEVVVQVAAGAAPQLLVRNDSDTVLVVYAETGERLFLVSRGGVQANVGSPSWAASNSPAGGSGPRGPERFVTVSRDPSWGWFDHRLHPARATLTEEQRASRTVLRLAEWTVPVRWGTRDTAIRGHVEYRPVLGRMRTRLAGTPPPGLDVVVLDGRVPGFFVSATVPVVVFGAAGEPFARVGPSGAEVNERSPTYVADAQLRGRAPAVPAVPASPHEPPLWRRVGAAPTLTWLDRRLAHPEPEPPAEVARAGRPAVLVEWRVPTDRGDLAGVTEWVPNDLRQRRPLWPWLAGGAAVLAALAGGRRLRNRTAFASPAGE